MVQVKNNGTSNKNGTSKKTMVQVKKQLYK